MGEQSRKAVVPLNAKMTKAIGELLSLARTGRLHGFAYTCIIEDADGDISAGSNAIWNGDPQIGKALTDGVKQLQDRMSPKSRIILNG